ncbi:MAG TPA: hypothetical protein VGF77_08440 [Allosphingosinicella sp.]|jgi:hypothetical protein
MAETDTGAAVVPGAAIDTSGPAKVKPAKDFSPSGAPNQVVDDVDPDHPAVDNNPRAGTTVNQNRIDFNDPNEDGPHAVARQLEEQGSKFVADDEVASDEK